jgi:hypothetical protein
MRFSLLAFATLLAVALLVSATRSGGSAPKPRLAVVHPLRASTPSGREESTAHRAARDGVSARGSRTQPSPGSLPQTHVLPSGTTAQFRSLMGSLWSGIVSGRLAPALPAFFPRGAYVQLKAIASAGSDWSDRLVHDYGLDIAAAHALLGRGAAAARLLAVDVPSGYGHWVPPGVCYNDIGYYEVPNSRVVYREQGRTRSFGIASMISWRGVWYVVHLGAILRSSDTGVVDEPALGRGSPAYSGTC